jgi:protein-S-isoprenylcysteine O-methyltransferase Ste14
MRNKHWIIIQTILLLLVLFWPFKIELPLPPIIRDAGIFFLIAGLVFGVVAVRALKDNLRPFPKPKVGGKLITTGLYSIVRHPAYGAILMSALGLSLWIGDGARLMLLVCLFLFFDAKSKIEEKWLEKTYPEYAGYKKQVTKRFIPWVY